MAWIKVDSDLKRKSEITIMARRMDVPVRLVMGMCVEFWGWADGQTEDGFIPLMIHADIDAGMGCPGFAKHMEEVGWLDFDGDGVILPNFERHNGSSAKRRAQNSRRMAKTRVQENK